MGGPIDPIGYDVAELRELARVRGDRYVAEGFLWTELPEPFPPMDETAGGDRPAAWSGSFEERQKPYLRDLPEGEEGRRVAREWIEALVKRGGAGAAVEALTYYESLGWLTEAAREALEGYLLAVDYRPGGSIEDLTRPDHVGSLARTARLAELADPPAGTGGASRSDASHDRMEGERDGDGDRNGEEKPEASDDEEDRGGATGMEEGDEDVPVDADGWWDGPMVDGDEPGDGDETAGDETAGEAEEGGTGTRNDVESGFEFGRSER